MRSRGSFVAVGSVRLDTEQSRKKLAELMQAMLVEAFHLGISHEELERFFMDSLQEWEQEKEEK